jgi:penicillin-binding protein 2
MFGTSFSCWKKGGHGTVSTVAAIESSCNVFFYQEGLKAGIDAISETANLFGFNAKTTIRLPNERPGFIPDRKWKMETKKDLWWPGETVSVSIGQGGVIVTPIQLINFMSTVANKGTLYQPKVVKKLSPPIDPDIDPAQPVVLRQIKMTASNWNLLHEGLKAVINGGAGTAKDLKMSDLVVAGKTGTAQVISDDAIKKLGYGRDNLPEKYQDHNWFVGFAPFEDPQVTVLIFIENGGKKGAREKAGIAKKVFKKWAEFVQKQNIPIDEPVSGEAMEDTDD